MLLWVRPLVYLQSRLHERQNKDKTRRSQPEQQLLL